MFLFSFLLHKTLCGLFYKRHITLNIPHITLDMSCLMLNTGQMKGYLRHIMLHLPYMMRYLAHITLHLLYMKHDMVHLKAQTRQMQLHLPHIQLHLS